MLFYISFYLFSKYLFNKICSLAFLYFLRGLNIIWIKLREKERDIQSLLYVCIYSYIINMNERKIFRSYILTNLFHKA